MYIKVKFKLTSISVILYLLSCNFLSISEARKGKKLKKPLPQLERKWSDEWRTECGLGTPGNKYPWNAAIYYSESIKCYGTIVSPYHIVTAAHCLVNDNIFRKKKLKARKFVVFAGKHNPNIREIWPLFSQYRKVEKVIKFDGNAYNKPINERDILVMIVDRAFEFTDNVRSACVDWQSFYEEWYIGGGNEGIIIGWKDDQHERIPCASSVQYWPKELCWENLPANFSKKYFGKDKSCAKTIEDNSTCTKALGAGLFFKAKQDRYFLNGITTLFDKKWQSYILYRKLSGYIEWLKVSLKRFKAMSPLFEPLEKPTYEIDGGCVLPHHIQYGKFSLITSRTYPEDTWVPLNTTIILSCEDSNETALSFRCAIFNKWDPPLSTAVCKKPGTCSTLVNSESEKIYCKLDGRPITCEEPSANTTAVIICEPFHIFPGYKPIYQCRNKHWDPPFTPCSLECGTKRVDVSTLVIGGTEASLNEYPWVVAIYFKNEQICGGTLISRLYVLSAAHCFVDSKGVRFPREQYTIIAGKYYRSISTEEAGSQKRKIKSIYVHENYRGSAQKYRDDIALIELDERFVVSLEVQPVCIDWENNYEMADFTLGQVGIVAGWGYTREGGSASDVLKKVIMPFQPKNECLKHLPTNFSHEFVASDKFCAGYIDKNTNVCQGDSGGGIYFKSDGAHYFIRGIVSMTRRSAVGCDSNQFSLYTKLSIYLRWIEKITRKVL